ncbi:hypothetical protein QYF36_026955 [Acer negundo]|nr:hypothetical protein QYF36_026955 [Acer negundo]
MYKILTEESNYEVQELIKLCSGDLLVAKKEIKEVLLFEKHLITDNVLFTCIQNETKENPTTHFNCNFPCIIFFFLSDQSREFFFTGVLEDIILQQHRCKSVLNLFLFYIYGDP